VRLFPGDGQAQRRGGMGGVRVLRQPLPVFLGLRLHLVCTLSGLPVLFALAGAKADERETLLGTLEAGEDVVSGHPGQTVIGDKNYFGRDFENDLARRGLVLLRPVRKGEARRSGQNLFKPLRQVIESVNWTFKGQLDLERHGGRTPRASSPESWPASSP
jgi:hypothetical protein